MIAVILAAGRGSRAAAAADVKPLLRIQGLALLERSIATAMRAGVREFVVVTGYASEQVEEHALTISRQRRVSIRVVENRDWERGNATSLLAARDLVQDPFLLLMGDHILDEQILQRLIEHGVTERGVRDDALVLAVDRSDPMATDIDLDDVTRVALRGDRIECIGKGLDDYDAFDTGAFLCSPAVFDTVESALKAGDGSLSAAVQRLAAAGRAGTVDVTGLPWADVDTPLDAARASGHLQALLTGKSRDGWVSRVLNRPLSTRVTTPLLLRLFPGITGNQASIVSAVFGLAATVCFILHLPWAAALFIHATSVLDGSDGEIARLKRLDSPFGGFFDAVLDRYTDSLIMLGLLYFTLSSGGIAGALGRAAEPVTLALGMLAVSGTWAVSYTTTKAQADLGHRYTGIWIGGGRGRDLRLLIVTIAALLAAFSPFAALAGMAAVAALTHVVLLRRLRLSWQQASGQTELAQVEAIIYDLDGTLVDSMPALTRQATGLLERHFGVTPGEARDRYTATAGADFATQLEEMFPAHPLNATVAVEFEAAKLNLLRDVRAFPDAQSALPFFASRGVRQFVCSSTRAELVRTALERSDLARFVEGQSGFRAGFGKSDQLRTLLHTYGLRPETTLFVGDSLRDAAFARRARTPFLGLARIFNDTQFGRLGATTVPNLSVLATRWDAAVRGATSLGIAPPPPRERTPERPINIAALPVQPASQRTGRSYADTEVEDPHVEMIH